MTAERRGRRRHNLHVYQEASEWMAKLQIWNYRCCVTGGQREAISRGQKDAVKHKHMSKHEEKKAKLFESGWFFLISPDLEENTLIVLHDRLKKEDAVIDSLRKPCVMRLRVQSLLWGFRLDRSFQQPQSSNIKQRCWRTSITHRLKQTARLRNGSVLNKFITWSSWEGTFLIWTSGKRLM